MKFKKYIFILLITITFGINKIYALELNSQEISNNNILQNYMPINILEIDCNGLFGSKNDPDSLRSLIDEILMYPRIIVPILVIVLGMIDLAKAVIASKEDEMKKAQSTFIKRLIIGVAFFFIPVFVDIMMWLADIVWNGMYTSCGL